MKIAESKTITLRAMTPIFCGSGETLDSLSFVIDGDTMRVIDADRFLESLAPAQLDQFRSWVENLAGKRAGLDAQIQEARNRKDFQRSGQLQRERNGIDAELSLSQFVAKRLGKSPGPFLAPYEKYSFHCHAKPDQGGFRAHIKDAQQRPYIPGTEIKGAIRTALLYSLISEPRGFETFKQLLNRIQGSEYDKARAIRKLGDQLETELLRGEFKGRRQNDAKYDSMRIIQISDSSPLPAEDLRLEMTQSLGTSRFTKTWIESIKYGAEMTAHLTLGSPELIAQTLGFGAIGKQLTLNGLFQACYQHSKDVLEEEAEYFRNEDEIFGIIEELIDENTEESPLIRLGGGQGFLSITATLAIKSKDPQLYENSIRKNVSAFRRWRTMPNNFPKTRRIIADTTGEALDCLGWVKMTDS
jgi:CRISPR-associated protein Csm5